MSSELRHYNGGYEGRCRLDDEVMNNLIDAINNNTKATEQSNSNHSNITRWLVGAIIVIAIGEKAIDFVIDSARIYLNIKQENK